MNLIRYALPIVVRKASSGIKLRFAGLVQVVKKMMPVVSATASHEVALVV